MITKPLLLSACVACLISTLHAQQSAPAGERPSPIGDANRFPIAVWLQSPHNAEKYKAIGINLYIALWNGPTDEQLAALEKAGMPLICDYSEKFKDRKIIAGWMHGDEPDNAQPLPAGRKGWGPPIPPEKIIAEYQQIKKLDPTRPVLLNLGQGVAWDNWHGRGVRTRHPEDYPEYAKGGDILSFDIYPVTHASPEVRGKLWYVGQGVRRLKQWAPFERPVWACIEATHIDNPNLKPTPQQTKSMAWMAIIHGAQGLIYFSHQFKPNFIEAGILADPEMIAGIKQINAQIQELAPVLNSESLPNLAAVSSSNGNVPIFLMNKVCKGDKYIFAINGWDVPVKGTFTAPDLKPGAAAVVLGEERTIPLADGKFTDDFAAYEVHLYRIKP